MRTLLPEGGPLEHVTRHLHGEALQNLRSTCRDLRHHGAILGAVKELSIQGCSWIEATVDLPYLGSMHNLRRLDVYDAPSLFALHCLSTVRLQHLSVCGLPPSADLTPLRRLTTLCHLSLGGLHSELFCIEQLSGLRQLTRLAICAQISTPGIGQLVSLQRLTIDRAGAAAEAALLPQLSHIELQCAGPAEIAQACSDLQHLHSLRTLVADSALNGCPILLHSLQLTRLRNLFLHLAHEVSPLDCSALPGLQLLGLSQASPDFEIVSPSVTCIRLKGAWEALPSVVACASLTRLTVVGRNLTIRAAQLPPQRVSIFAHIRGNVFSQLRVPHRFHLELVDRLNHSALP